MAKEKESKTAEKDGGQKKKRAAALAKRRAAHTIKDRAKILSRENAPVKVSRKKPAGFFRRERVRHEKKIKYFFC